MGNIPKNRDRDELFEEFSKHARKLRLSLTSIIHFNFLREIFHKTYLWKAVLAGEKFFCLKSLLLKLFDFYIKASIFNEIIENSEFL